MQPKRWRRIVPLPTGKLLAQTRTTTPGGWLLNSGGSAIGGRTTRHEDYAQSIHARRGIEKVFGWIKHWGGLRQFRLRGSETVGAVFSLHVIACNPIRPGSLPEPAMAAS